MAKRDMTFLNGIIKSLEKELLTPATLMRIIDEPDYKSAFRALKEQGFGKNAATDEADSEAILQAETLALDDFAREFSPGDEYSEFCLSGIDFYNAERLLRSGYIRGFGFVQTRTGLIGDVAAALKTGEKNAKYGKTGQSGGKDKNALLHVPVPSILRLFCLYDGFLLPGAADFHSCEKTALSSIRPHTCRPYPARSAAPSHRSGADRVSENSFLAGSGKENATRTEFCPL